MTANEDELLLDGVAETGEGGSESPADRSSSGSKSHSPGEPEKPTTASDEKKVHAQEQVTQPSTEDHPFVGVKKERPRVLAPVEEFGWDGKDSLRGWRGRDVLTRDRVFSRGSYHLSSDEVIMKRKKRFGTDGHGSSSARDNGDDIGKTREDRARERMER